MRCTKALETTFSALHSGLAQKQRQRNPIQPNPTPAKLTQQRQLVSNEQGPTWSNQWEIEEAFLCLPHQKAAMRQSEVVESIHPTECQEELGSMFTVEGWLLKKSPN
jgi:hypothetical protein